MASLKNSNDLPDTADGTYLENLSAHREQAGQAPALTGEIGIGTSEAAAAVRPISQCRHVPRSEPRLEQLVIRR